MHKKKLHSAIWKQNFIALVCIVFAINKTYYYNYGNNIWGGLYYEGKAHNKKYRFQPQIIKKYVRVIDLMASLNSTEDFYRYKALHYEALVGDKKDRESVRVNDQYRIEFHSEVVGNEKQITICNILELSNHYK